MDKNIKTNAMRILDKEKIKYEVFTYPHEEGVVVDGDTVAKLLGVSPDCVFKTLVLVSDKKEHFVFMVRVKEELDLKKCARVAGVKNLELIMVKDLFPLTGYVRGGCSPIGMKKSFKTFIDEYVMFEEEIYFSAGKIGYQIKMNKDDLISLLNLEMADIEKE
jgi:Cys-tRNA(Pro)/Cys-tRNA(Cys) deacylase